MSEEDDQLENGRIIFENRPVFSVWQPELGHLPYVVIRFEKGDEDDEDMDLYITVGGGAFGNGSEPEDIAEFLRDVADMIDESSDFEDDNPDPDDPDNWD